jgi:hypothetical protein
MDIFVPIFKVDAVQGEWRPQNPYELRAKRR